MEEIDETRIITTFPMPPRKPLETEQIFTNNSVDWNLIRNFLKKEGMIKSDDFQRIIKMAL